MGWLSNLIEKLNPAQSDIVDTQGKDHYTSTSITKYIDAYNKIEVVNRGVNLTVDSAAGITIDVGDKLTFAGIVPKQRPQKIETLLNFRPNPYQSADQFKRSLYIDLIVEGNAFIYWDGAYLYNIPAVDMEVEADTDTFIRKYKYGKTEFDPEEIIHIMDNSASSIFRGKSRLASAMDSINALNKMVSYQTNFFKNNAIPGLVLKSPNVLSKKVKERIILEWMRDYNPSSGGRKPMLLDGDFELDNLGGGDFRELDFSGSINTHENKILKALGVPIVLLDGGNNANISPNNKLFYSNTVLPLVEKVSSAFERFFGYDLKPVTQDILALRPELRDEANYLSTLTNAGIMSQNEAREKIRLEKSDDESADQLVKPANVAGSASDSTVGGRPSGDSNNE